VREQMTFHVAEDVKEVLAVALRSEEEGAAVTTAA